MTKSLRENFESGIFWRQQVNLLALQVIAIVPRAGFLGFCGSKVVAISLAILNLLREALVLPFQERQAGFHAPGLLAGVAVALDRGKENDGE